MARPFSFDNAAFHFARTDGPPGFLPKFLAAYAIGIVVIGLIGFVALQPIIEAYLRTFALIAQGASESQIERELSDAILLNMGRIGFGYLGVMLAYAAFWAAMESAVLRRYVRDEGFTLGWGADEWRMLAVGLIWLVAFIAAYLAFVIVLGVVLAIIGSSVQSNPGPFVLLAFILMAAAGFVWAYAAVKLSPAGAMTIRDRSVTFFGAWGATSGRFWPMFGAFIILGLILYVGIMILYMAGVFAVLGSVMGNIDTSNGEVDPDAIVALFASPGTWIPLAVVYFIMLIYQGVWQYAWAGIPALAAKTDPRTGGTHNAADQF